MSQQRLLSSALGVTALGCGSKSAGGIEDEKECRRPDGSNYERAQQHSYDQGEGCCYEGSGNGRNEIQILYNSAQIMKKQSAGLLMYRRAASGVECFLVHPGGPFWEKKDLEAWSIPKGEHQDDEEPRAAALREFQEETGLAPAGELVSLGQIRQSGGKVVTAWALEGDCDETQIRSNLFSMEWPPKSGRMKEFPEVDRGAWFPVDLARQKILKGQAGFLDRLAELLKT